MTQIQMVDLKGQYLKIKEEIDSAIQEVVDSAAFINGPAVQRFQEHLEEYLDVKHGIPCANGTDALQIALMALGLEPGDEVIVPAFTYVATAEVIALLRLTPVMVDVDYDTFNVTAEIIEEAVTPKTKAVVPVHLFGQSCDMESIMEVARKYNIFVVEDNAQSLGSEYTFSDGSVKKAGTNGDISTTSFYPAKNLGCFGDGGAMFTNDDDLAGKLRTISNHGQSRTYYHDIIGVNSRLDSIQAAVLDVKLRYLDKYAKARNSVADLYDEAFSNMEEIEAPVRQQNSTHVFHQYTIRVKNGGRDELKEYLSQKEIPTSIFYPVPLNKQKAFSPLVERDSEFLGTESLCKEVLSLPIHTELNSRDLEFISETLKNFFINSKAIGVEVQ